MTAKELGEQPAWPMDEIDPSQGHYDGRYEVKRQFPGLTIRMWLAGRAMQGLRSNANYCDVIGNQRKWESGAGIAAQAVADADALLDALAKEQT